MTRYEPSIYDIFTAFFCAGKTAIVAQNPIARKADREG